MDWSLIVVLCCTLVGLGQSTLTPPNGFILDDFGDDGFFITIAGRKIIEHSKTHPFISIGTGSTKYLTGHGIADVPGDRYALKFYRVFREENEIHITLTDNKNIHLTLTLLSDERNKLTIRFADFPKAYDRVWLRFVAETAERVYGGGQRLGTFDLRGQSVAIWSADKTSSTESSYPMFTFVSSRLYYCSVSGHNYGRMDFTQTDSHELYVVGLPESINLNADVSFEKLMRKLTYFQGRPPTLPEWFGQGLIVGVQGGQVELFKQVELATQHDINVGGVLIADWSNGLSGKSAGVSDWTTNSALYPEWEKLVQTLKQKSIDVYGAINPFLAKGSTLFDEAQSLGYLATRQNNDSYLIGGSQRGIVDLTSEPAYNWFKDVLKNTILKLGVRGWMADVDQGAPADGVYQSDESEGVGGAVTHNMYPLLWAKVNRRACQEADLYAPQTPFPIVLPLETVFFTRAGTKDTTRVSPLSHAGPAGADFASLSSALRAVLSLAVSGGGLSHFTLGWSSVDQSAAGGATEELVLRSAELAVFSPVMRTENTLAALKLSENGLRTLATLVRMHNALHDYTIFSSQRFTREGVSLVRPLVFHCDDSSDTTDCATVYDEFFYGRDVLVAPVLQAGAVERRLYVPTGKWVYAYDSTHVLTGPTWVTIKAPIGRVPAFYRQESDWSGVFEKFASAADKLSS